MSTCQNSYQIRFHRLRRSRVYPFLNLYGISLFIISYLLFSFSSTLILPHLNLDIYTCKHLLLPTGSKHQEWSLKIENIQVIHTSILLSRYGFLHCRWSVVSMTMDGFLSIPDHLPEILEKIGKLSEVKLMLWQVTYVTD